MAERVVKWVTRSLDDSPVYPGRRAYSDPTADRAIANVMREERRKKRQAERCGQYRQKRHTVGVWKAGEGGASHAGK